MNIVLALILIQPPPPGTTGELQFPRQATPYSCSAGREGRVYYDMDTDLPYYCDDTNWVTFGVTISGTNPYLARFNSAGNNVEDSDLRNSGVPAAGASGNIFDITETVNAFDGSDIVQALFIDITNASHTGGSNGLRAITVDSITGSVNATEIAFLVSGGWDEAFHTNGLTILGGLPAAGTGGTVLSFPNTVAAMDGGDTVKLIGMTYINANHTGASNTLIGVDVGSATPDADATEIGIVVGDDVDADLWDRDISFKNSASGHPHLYFEEGSTIATLDSADSTPQYIFNGNGTTLMAFQDGSELTHLMGTDLSLSGTTLTIDPNANVVEVFGDGSDTVSIITAPTTTSHTERVTFICQDADVTFIDADAAGAAGTINLAGAATDFVCSADDTLTLAYYVAPVSGNARWVEVSRSVN